jgi:site-specific DNA recombinase
MTKTIRRCAIYTRKSSEEGLEQDYNSLHAQREACEAFIQSQAGEGWRLVKTAYDDGGFSGAGMERPGLQQLLTHIRERLGDTVVVYKVDRLTRALTDFAKMVELFDARAVSFVAVTQQFNTTTSMGRLTLNVLLSFAQFEREVIGERIRDKVAASKRKGIWMGGVLPLGYDVHERKLVVNQDEAATVRQIFERYFELGSVRQLANDLHQRGIVSGSRVSRNGKARGGGRFSRGALYHLLSNPIYRGEIRHKHECHPGQHEAIVGRELWERVQQRLRDRGVRNGEGRKTEAPRSPLAGKLVDESGEPLYVQGAAKGQRRYRYYVSRTLVRGTAESTEQGWRISAPEIEQRVAAAAREMLGDRPALALALEQSGLEPHRLPAVLQAAHAWCEGLTSKSEAATELGELVERVQLSRQSLNLSLKVPLAPTEPSDLTNPLSLPLSKSVPLQLKRRGNETRVILEGSAPPNRVDLPLLKAVARTRRWAGELLSGKAHSVRQLARREAIDARSVRRLMPLGFLAPRIIEAIVAGRQPPELTLEALTRRIDLPLLWSAQEHALRIV